MKIIQIIVSIFLGIMIGLMIQTGSKNHDTGVAQSLSEKPMAQLREGTYSPIHPDWQRIWIEVKKTTTNGVYEVISGGSNGAAAPYDEQVFVIRQLPSEEKLQIIGAYEYECTPIADSAEIKREGGEMAPERIELMSLILNGDLLLVNGLAYDLR